MKEGRTTAAAILTAFGRSRNRRVDCSLAHRMVRSCPLPRQQCMPCTRISIPSTASNGCECDCKRSEQHRQRHCGNASWSMSTQVSCSICIGRCNSSTCGQAERRLHKTSQKNRPARTTHIQVISVRPRRTLDECTHRSRRGTLYQLDEGLCT